MIPTRCAVRQLVSKYILRAFRAPRRRVPAPSRPFASLRGSEMKDNDEPKAWRVRRALVFLRAVVVLGARSLVVRIPLQAAAPDYPRARASLDLRRRALHLHHH